MRRLTSTTLALVAVGTLSGTLLAAGPSTGAAADQRAAAKPHYVDFALKASGYGSATTGGQVPTDSGQTAFMAVGCATKVGIDKENHEAESTAPGLGKATDVKTELWTREVNGVVSTYAQNTTNKLVIAQSGAGSIQIKAITAWAHSFHDQKGFHAETRTDVGSIQFVPPGGGAPQQMDIPTPGNPLEIPGLATITVGRSKKHVDADGAQAQANALIITKTASGTKSKVGQAKAQVLNGVTHGTFHGYSAGSSSLSANGNVSNGRTPLSLMPCQSTDGQVTTKKIQHSDLGGGVIASDLQSQQFAEDRANKSVAWERGSVSHLTFGGDQLDVDGVIGKAKAIRQGGKVTKTIKGSTVGTITSDGEEQQFPDTDMFTIPGVAKLERFITERTRNGISVIALRITLLDGSGSVIDLGQAKIAIRAH
ncbi:MULTISPECIES: choice-of-anchor P family protein [unclassified Nocardioides]|uniref:choice-of-anchor P family protein n=1 Tax=unclassified Nocardioides TaxID=2615069 RepID=UPI0009F08772|nr:MULTISPECIES: choice-of-anchor P family protein [unclassified Nocardioides]GAW51642.1 uncharacterized protein (Precursor) [Nocardioides sp. PD653-B2]GAW55390.1 uncharacterized protein (Precursor) [Nocardioides sp. PD653]